MNKIYININDIPPISEVVEFENTPILPENGLMIGVDCVGSIEVTISKKGTRNMIRRIKREFLGTNNYRKLHGLPMYRR